MKPILLMLGALLALAGCQTTVYPSEAAYAQTEASRLASVDRCRVIEARRVSLGAEPINRSSRWGARMDAPPEAQIGAVAGVVVGSLIGASLGQSGDQALGATLGATFGAVAGSAAGAEVARGRMARAGIEYSILDQAGNERLIVQHVNPGDRIVPAGGSCRLARTSQGTRVLPAGHLPETVNRPKTTSYR